MNKINLLYLVSAPYSGSTLVSFLLGSHRSIASAGELSGPDPRIKPEDHQCSCGVPTAKCPFWNEIQHRLTRKGLPFSILEQNKGWQCAGNRYLHHALTRTLYPAFLDKLQGSIVTRVRPFKQRVVNFLSTNLAVMKEIMDYYGACVFLDTSKDIDRLQILKRAPGVEVKVLHLVRDGRGQTSSKVRRGTDMGQAAKSLVRFDNQAQNLEHLAGPGRYLRVRYEDICREPERNLGRIASFAGLDPDGFPENFKKQDTHHLGNPMRFTFKGQIELDERWRTELTDQQLQTFYRTAGDRNKRYDY